MQRFTYVKLLLFHKWCRLHASLFPITLPELKEFLSVSLYISKISHLGHIPEKEAIHGLYQFAVYGMLSQKSR